MTARRLAHARCWILSDGRPGMESQCLGLAAALGLTPEIKRIDLRAPWRWLPPALQPWPLVSVAPGSDDISPPWPEVLIATGRKAAALAAALRERSKGACFTIQIQNSTLSAKRFDAVILPEHDGVSGENVIATLGALGRITPRLLAEAARKAPAGLLSLPRPRVALILGGPNSVYQMPTPVMAEQIGIAVTTVAREGGSLMISASARTPGGIKDELTKAAGRIRSALWRDARDGDNPYLAFLGLADFLFVSADSVNMLSEAAATGKPVFVLELPGGSPKFRKFHDSLRERGIARPFQGKLETWSYEPLAETERVAGLLLPRLNAHLQAIASRRARV